MERPMEAVIDAREALAEVRAAGTTTRYRRVGTGSPLLLLCDAADERFASMLEGLAGQRSVIAPDGSAAEGWMRLDRLTSFLDGLGLGPVPVVGVGRAAGPAAALARLHPERVERLVLLGELEGPAAAHVDLALAALARRTD